MDEGLKIDHLPGFATPTLVLGLDGWPNGGNVAVGVVDYLIQALRAEPFARVDPGPFYRFDDLRPVVKVEDGVLKDLRSTEAVFYAARREGSDGGIVLFRAGEPHLLWKTFVELLLGCCKKVGVELIISLGGLQDNVVHTEAMVSGLASDPELLQRVASYGVRPISYEGPGAIHALILRQGKEAGIEGLSLWGHCPFYLQGSHLKLMAHMTDIVADLTNMEVDTGDLEKGWMQLARQIERFIEDNPQLDKMVKEMMGSKKPARPPRRARKDGKVIYLDEVFKPKD